MVSRWKKGVIEAKEKFYTEETEKEKTRWGEKEGKTQTFSLRQGGENLVREAKINDRKDAEYHSSEEREGSRKKKYRIVPNLSPLP